MCQKLSTRVRPKRGQDAFSADLLARILTNLTAEYGALARVDVGRDADGPWIEVHRTPMLTLLPTPTDARTDTTEEHA